MKYLESKTKTVVSISAAMLTVMLTACGETSSQAPIQVAKQSPAPSITQSVDATTIEISALTFSAEHAVKLDKQNWLSLGMDSGLNLISQSHTESQSAKQGEIAGEYLDIRKQADGSIKALSVSHDQKLMLTTIDTQQQTITQRLSHTLTTPLEGVCLYQPKYEPLQVFLLGEDHMAHQLLITEKEDALELTQIRAIPLPPSAEYCTVDDQRHHFYVNEEDIGVWQYGARSESMIKRELVELVAPRGKLQTNSGPMAIVNGSLLLSEKGGNHIHTYALNNSVPDYIQSFELSSVDQSADIINDGMNATAGFTEGSTEDNSHTANIVVLDEASEQLLNAIIPLPTRTSEKASNASESVKRGVVQIPVDMETQPVEKKGDAADDPAIWVHPTQPEQSRVLGTNKKQGLFVYDLNGELLQSLYVDRVNNVDVRKGFTHSGKPMDIAAASQRDRHAIALFKIHPETGHMDVAEEIVTTLDDVYGMCMSKGANGDVYVFINDEDGRYEQWHIIDSDEGWSGKKVRSFSVSSQPEGCTVDEKNQRLFVGEEAKGVWTLGAEPSDSTDMTLIAEVGKTGLVADVEGMEIYQTGSTNWLVVSSQGDDSYLIFEAEAPYTQLAKFRLGMNAESGIDGVSETDGLTVTAAFLGAQYPQGVMVAQDGRNHMPEANQNFKLVDWRKVQNTISSQP